MDRINFYGQTEENGYLSNFSHHGFDLDGKWWMTVEHYYQAMKFDDEDYQEKIRLADRPGKTKRMGNDRTGPPLRANWNDIKDAVMYEAVYAKFVQNDEIRQNLLATGDAHLSEHTVNDKYWGDGGDDSGKNMLGKTLMAVRNQIRFDIILE